MAHYKLMQLFFVLFLFFIFFMDKNHIIGQEQNREKTWELGRRLFIKIGRHHIDITKLFSHMWEMLSLYAVNGNVKLITLKLFFCDFRDPTRILSADMLSTSWLEASRLVDSHLLLYHSIMHPCSVYNNWFISQKSWSFGSVWCKVIARVMVHPIFFHFSFFLGGVYDQNLAMGGL